VDQKETVPETNRLKHFQKRIHPLHAGTNQEDHRWEAIGRSHETRGLAPDNDLTRDSDCPMDTSHGKNSRHMEFPKTYNLGEHNEHDLCRT